MILQTAQRVGASLKYNTDVNNSWLILKLQLTCWVLPFPFPAKPPKTLGEFFGRLLIIVVLLGALYLLGMAMLQSFIDGFLPYSS